MTSLNQPFHYCGFCCKKYARKIPYNKHVLLCEIIHKPKRVMDAEAEENNEGIPVPTNRQLYSILQEMAFKYKKMEDKLNAMTKLRVVANKQKNRDIMEYLASVDPSINTFYHWIHNAIRVSSEDVERLLKNTESFVDILILVIKRAVSMNDMDMDRVGIRAFTEKPNVLYIYKNKEQQQQQQQPTEPQKKEWIIMSTSDLSSLQRIVHSKLVLEIHNWKVVNQQNILKNDKLDDMVNKMLIRVMRANLEQTTKTKQVLYTLLKKCDDE